MTISFAVYFIINTVFILLISPLFMGWTKRIKAILQGRRGPPLLQTYYLLGKLLKKEQVFSCNASFISRIAPYINLVFLLAASLFVPVTFIPGPVFGVGNVILFLYLMVTARFFMALGGLDAGSSFGGMGSSREMTISAIFEPMVVIVVAALAFVLKTWNIHEMFTVALGSLVITDSAIILISIALFVVLIVETSRIPVDNPETHLELTMIHEAMLLESSGPNLALMELSHAVKNTLLMALLINVLVPWGLSASLNAAGIFIAMATFLFKGIVLATIVAVFESLMAKSRLFNLRTLFMVAFALAFLTIVFELLI